MFESEFFGMAANEATYQELLDTRTKLLQLIRGSLTNDERKFLLSIKCAEPNWQLIDIEGIENFPALKWKLLNIEKIEKTKYKRLVDNLKRILEL